MDLDPRFVRYETRIEERTFRVGEQATWEERGRPTEKRTGPSQHILTVETLAEAQGVEFLCPKCFAENGGPVGTHWCSVSFEGRGVADDQGTHDAQGQPVRWQVSGTDLSDLTTQPSILIVGGCAWHGFITNGEASP